MKDDIKALELRIHMLEAAFATTEPRNTSMIYLLQLELENVYKSYMNLMCTPQKTLCHAH